MYLAFVYDCIRILRIKRKRKQILTFVENLLFWLYATYKALAYLYEHAQGTLRVYMLVFAFAGVLVYEIGIGRYYLHFAGRLFTMELVKGKIKHGKGRSGEEKSDAQSGTPKKTGKSF